MLASRRGDTNLNRSWSFSKLEAPPFSFPFAPRKTSSSPRMSNTGFETPLSNATEWTGQYSFLPPAESIFAAHPYDHIGSGPADPVSIAVTSGGIGGTVGGSNGANAISTISSANNISSHHTSMASTASTTSSNGANTTIGALLSNSGHNQNHSHSQSQTRPSTSTNSGDGSVGTKASSASPLGMHNRRGLDPLGLRQASQSQHHGSSSQLHTGGSLRSPSTPASDHHGSQAQHLHQHHQHLQHHQHQAHHHYQQPQQPQHPQHQHQQHQQHHHGSDSYDISPTLSNPLSGSMSNPLSAALQLPGIVTHFGGTHNMNMSNMSSLSSLSSLNSLNSISHMNGMRTEMGHGEDHAGIKGEDDDLLDSEDMGGAEEPEGMPPQPQTAAERISQRRKMKRFRLTHQQTRFLMSEFAKQPHPDASHRERLSREIPGLSPRQVQVWFQNRRAKIKRLATDDRERMIKMRAVPDDFDNVQALHSPYGAVHGLGTPMASPVDFNAAAAAAAAAASPYGDHMMRPLMVDVRRSEGGDHMSPTGLSPAFGGIGFNPSGAMHSSDILSPLSPSSSSDHHRYANYSSQLSTAVSATSASTTSTVGGPRTSMPYARPGTGNIETSSPHNNSSSSSNNGTSGSSGSNSNSANTGSGSTSLHHHHQQRHQIRPLQPLQLREAMSRSRSDNQQSPLRSSMSWKGDSLDYSSYHTGSGSPQLAGRSQQALYPSDASTSYDNPYSDSTVRSPTPMAYQGFPSLGLQATSPSRSSRLRVASATLPLAPDLTSGGRDLGSRSSMGSATAHPMGSLNSLESSSYAAHSTHAAQYPTSSPLTPLTYGMADFSQTKQQG